MTLKLKLPAFLSRTPDPAGETVTARTVLDSDRPASQRKIPFSADLLRQFPVAKQLQVLGGCLVLVMLLIAIDPGELPLREDVITAAERYLV